MKADGTIYQAGEVIKLPLLGESYQKIAEDPVSMYTGQLAHDIVADIADAGNNDITTFANIVDQCCLPSHKYSSKQVRKTILPACSPVCLPRAYQPTHTYLPTYHTSISTCCSLQVE